MARFRGMSVARRLLVGIGSVILLAAIVLAVSFVGLTRLNDNLDRIIDTHVQSIVLSARLNRNIEELRVQERELLMAQNHDHRHVAQEAIDALNEEISDRLEALHQLVYTEQGRSHERTFRKAHDAYSAALRKLQDRLDENDSGSTNKASVDELRTQAEESGELATEQARQFVELQEAHLGEMRQASDRLAVGIFLLSSLLMILALVLGLTVSILVGGGIARSIDKLVRVADSIAQGDLQSTVDTAGSDEIAALSRSISNMQDSLRTSRQQTRDQDWLKTGVARLNEALRGEQEPVRMASKVISEVCSYMEARVGALYVVQEESGEHQGELRLLGSYAYEQRKALSHRFARGEGLVGQSYLEGKQILVDEVPEDYIRVVSGLGNAVPRSICVTPFLYEDKVRGVLELGLLTPAGSLELAYLDQVAPAVAAAYEIVQSQAMLREQERQLRSSNSELQEQTAALARSSEELEAQREQLQRSNSELEEQTMRLKQSEESLRTQQEELEVVNTELKDRNVRLERQKREVEEARAELSRKAEELALASKYKSAFLANMSHELRTPLNSLLILARDLSENGEGNLTTEQSESAKVIFDSGSDLLNLINEILDLSKIEAGRMEVSLDQVPLSDLADGIRTTFTPMAQTQGLGFEVDISDEAPSSIRTDGKRLMQVIRNLIGNALKFTERGQVSVKFEPEAHPVQGSEPRLAIRVIDTGIGIPKDKQKLVFEAFQQADSGDKRRYGGTGLGLSISRELAGLLGGEITLESEQGKGSTFTLLVPLELTQSGEAAPTPAPVKTVRSAPKSDNAPPPVVEPEPRPPMPQTAVADDREGLREGDRVILIVDDDVRFASILAADTRKKGFKVLVAHSGEDGLALARAHLPLGVILDLHLPQMDGWATLAAMKDDTKTRHIPVHIVSVEEPSTELRRIGAIGHASKPIDREGITRILDRLEGASASATKRVLVVEDDPIMRRETVRLVGEGNVAVEEVATGEEALKALRSRHYDLLLLDLGLPDMGGQKLLSTLAEEHVPAPPVIIHTVRQLTREEESALRDYADSIILKDVRSKERLMDEIALFLHRVVTDLPEDSRRVINDLRQSDQPLRGRRVLVVEDDMRTMFAMARLLASHGVSPVKAENGQKALEVLNVETDIDLVLMDMMMPVMDGYEAIRRIRQQDRFAMLPIIALTAKAMKEDRKKCLDAGATEYLSKPVDKDRLISLLRVWLAR